MDINGLGRIGVVYNGLCRMGKDQITFTESIETRMDSIGIVWTESVSLGSKLSLRRIDELESTIICI